MVTGWSKWLVIAALTGGVWQNLAMVVLWWTASRSKWSVIVDFNTRGEALFEGLLVHATLAILLLACIVAVVSIKQDRKARTHLNPFEAVVNQVSKGDARS